MGPIRDFAIAVYVEGATHPHSIWAALNPFAGLKANKSVSCSFQGTLWPTWLS